MSLDPLIYARHPATGEFSDYATKNLADGRFYELWHPEHFTNAVDITGLSNYVDNNEGGVLSTLSSLLYPFQWENDFFYPYPLLARTYWYVPYVLSVIYIYFVLHLGPKLMENRKPVECHTSLKYWNLFLAIFSLVGMIRTVPHLLISLGQLGWDGVLCHTSWSTYGCGPCGLWTALFIASKVFEFIDTLFLIIRKRPVSLLHWWHHSSVLLYCWDALMWETPSGIVFVAMNYSVHALMYFYYYLAATINRESQTPTKSDSKKVGPDSGESTTVDEKAASANATSEKPKRKANPIWWAHIVTKLQILQMIIGMITVVSHLYYRRRYENCDGSASNLYFAGFIYASYFVLFGQFYMDRYKSQIASVARRVANLLSYTVHVKQQ